MSMKYLLQNMGPPDYGEVYRYDYPFDKEDVAMENSLEHINFLDNRP
jgi:hypothetical protein